MVGNALLGLGMYEAVGFSQGFSGFGASLAEELRGAWRYPEIPWYLGARSYYRFLDNTS